MSLWNWCIDCSQHHTLLGVFIWRSKTHRKTAILVCIDLCDNWQVSTFTTGPRSNCVRVSTKSLSQSIDTESLSTSLSSSSVINRIKLWLTVLATSLIYRYCQGQYILYSTHSINFYFPLAEERNKWKMISHTHFFTVHDFLHVNEYMNVLYKMSAPNGYW